MFQFIGRIQYLPRIHDKGWDTYENIENEKGWEFSGGPLDGFPI
jgi:hypothetical protein